MQKALFFLLKRSALIFMKYNRRVNKCIKADHNTRGGGERGGWEGTLCQRAVVV